jgi:hypothetical protein
MRLCSDPRVAVWILLILSSLAFSSEVQAHAPRHHTHIDQRDVDQGAQKASPQVAAPVQPLVALTSSKSLDVQGQGPCGGSMCCGSVCGSCCPLVMAELFLPIPGVAAKRLKFAKGSPQSGIASERIRRPPKS